MTNNSKKAILPTICSEYQNLKNQGQIFRNNMDKNKKIENLTENIYFYIKKYFFKQKY